MYETLRVEGQVVHISGRESEWCECDDGDSHWKVRRRSWLFVGVGF